MKLAGVVVGVDLGGKDVDDCVGGVGRVFVVEAHACHLLVRCVGEGETWSMLWVIVRLETLACTGFE